MHFDPWGQRQNLDGAVWNQWLDMTQPAWADAMLDITPRGFTGHEHLDQHGIIHMNGRIYDPRLGRFLQADPFIEDTGTLNRYTYVHNNPLSYTDPSGFFSLKKFVRTVASVAVAAFAPQFLPFASLVNVAVAGGLAGYIATGTINGALFGSFSAMAFHGIGVGFDKIPAKSALRGSFLGTKFSSIGLALKSVAHGLTGGVLSTVQGGKFVHGFAAAGVTQFASGGINLIGGTGFSPLRVVAAAVLGGTVSEISGGKFANGAVTGAFSRAFNDEPNVNRGESPVDRRIGEGSESFELVDRDALLVFEALGVGDQRLDQLRNSMPLDQEVLDIAIEGLAAASLGNGELNRMAETAANMASTPLRARSIRFTLRSAHSRGEFSPDDLREVLNSRFDGVGQAMRTAAGLRIKNRLDRHLLGY